jgi:hypothetical protein
VKVSASDEHVAENRPPATQYTQLMLLPHALPSAGSERGHTEPLGGRLCDDHLHRSDAAHAVGPIRENDGAQYAH